MELFIGQIILVPYNSVPDYMLPCDGRALSIAQNSALFSLLGTRSGGDGRTTFNLPDLRAISPPYHIYAIATDGVFPSRS